MALKQYIEKLSTDMGFEQALEAKEDGSYSLRFDPGLDITVRENSESIIQFHTKLAPLPKDRTDEYLMQAMTANLFGRETGETALGLDQEGKHVVLVDFLTENETYHTFYEQLEKFVNYAEAWRQETLDFIEMTSSNAEE